MTDYKISKLYIHPIKSLHYVEVESFNVVENGAEFDRQWMIIDENDRFITQRTVPRMALIQPTIQEENLVINIPKESPRVHDIEEFEGEPRIATIWKDLCSVVEVSSETSEKLSRFLDTPVKLVRMAPRSSRKLNERYTGDNHRHINFQDSQPFLIISESSLSVLNSKLKEPLPMNRFRPNIVISGSIEAHDEDKWKEIKIGDLSLQFSKLCTRCTITSTDQETGERKDREPLTTLKTYRMTDKGISFGAYFIHQNFGKITLGDTVEIQQ